MNQQPDKPPKQIQEALQDKVGRLLTALYQFKNTVKENNLLALFQEETSIHHIRAALRPLYQKNKQLPLPLITTPSTLKRHLQLDPHLAHRLAQTGRLLTGTPQEINHQPPTEAQQISHLASAALKASPALAPQLLTAGEALTATQNLFRIANQLDINQNPSSPIETFAAIQAHLAQLIAGQPQLAWQAPPPSDAPPLLISLRSIYEMDDQAIFLLPDWPPNRIKNYIIQVDWTAVSQTLTGQYQALKISTPTLFRLIIHHYRPAAHYFRNYTHAWGQDPLADLQIPHHQVLKELAHFPSQMEIKTFPHAYIAANDDQLDRLIHDYQNKLLNIQLREELLSRLDGRSRVVPPAPLPDPAVPNSQRVAVIHQQFNWWANHYTNRWRTEKT